MSRFPNIEELYEALRSVSRGEREQALDRWCPGDAALQADLESLLAAEDSCPGFLDGVALDRLPEFGVGIAQLPADEELVGANVGPYRVERRLGAGGGGVVFLARGEEPPRPVALKILARGLSSDAARQRFRMEGAALAQLSHPCIAHVWSTGVHSHGDLELPYLAMELVEGARDLATHIEHLPRRAVVDLVAQVADAAHHAHQRGVVHRDLKPGNVLVDDEGGLKVIDFGIARVGDDDGGPSLMGTPRYMAPELVTGGETAIDTRVDVYSLGVMLEELMGEAQPLQPDLAAIVRRAHAEDPEARYGSAEAFARDLRHYLAREPVSARPRGIVSRVGLAARRNPVATALGVLAVLGLTVMTLHSVRSARVARAGRRTAEEALGVANQLNAYLDAILWSATPEGDLGRDQTLSEAFEQAAQLIELDDLEPAIQAPLRIRIAGAYEALMESEKAWFHLRRARSMANAEQRADLDAMGVRLFVLNEEYAAGRELALEGLGRLAASGLEREVARAQLVHALARCESGLGLVAESKAHFDEARRILERDPEGNGRRLLTLAMHEARTALRSGELDRAEEAFAEAKRWLDSVPMDHPIAIVLRSDVASLAKLSGDPVAARAGWISALESARRVYEPEHPLIGALTANLGSMEAMFGDAQRAEELLNEALEIERAEFGDLHPRVASTMGRLAQAAAQRDAPEIALTWMGEANRIFAELYPSLDDERRAGHEREYVLLLLRLGRVAEASERVAPLAERDRRLLGGNTSSLSFTETLAAGAFLGSGDPERALDHAQRAYAIRRETLGEDAWLTANSRNLYGACLAATGDPEAGRKHMSAAVQTVERVFGPDHANTRMVRGRLERYGN